MRILLVLLPVMLAGCVARAAYDVVTLPVRAGSQVVDWTTTSRSEADRNLGRSIRKRNEREARERAKAEKATRKQARDDAARTREATGD